LKLRKTGGVFWPGTYVQRAGAAMREKRSQDYLVLARCALEHAIRTEADIDELVRPAEPASDAQFTTAQNFPPMSCPPAGRRAAASHR
jgi:hypothetical protein